MVYWPAMSQIRVRIAPSPTGALHVGTARTALFNLLFARKVGGDFLVRIEDTDRERSQAQHEREILEGLEQLGMVSDETPVRQSERSAKYAAALQSLQQSGACYPCFCTAEELAADRERAAAEKRPPRYNGKYRNLPKQEATERIAKGEPHTWRFRVPEGREIVFEDAVRGRVTVNSAQMDDFIIARTDGTPTYHLAVCTDDADMRITHIIRGEDHLPNTPKHILLFEALGAPLPAFCHLPLLLSADRKKLSKRSGTATSVADLLSVAPPEAIINFLAMLGWNPGDEREMFTFPELVEAFSLEKLQKGGAIFDEKRLEFFTARHLQQMPPQRRMEVLTTAMEGEPLFAAARAQWGMDFLSRAVAAAAPRIRRLSDLPEAMRVFLLSEDDFAVPSELLTNEKMGVTPAVFAQALDFCEPLLRQHQDQTDPEKLGEIIMAAIAATGQKNGAVLWPLRVALSGAARSPSPFELFTILGPERSFRRVDKARGAM